MKKYFLIFIITSIYFSVISAQETNTDEKQFQEKQFSKTILINKKRNLLQDYLIENDIIKANEVFKELINEVEDKLYRAFSSHEKWLLSIWFEEFDIIKEEATNYDSLYVQPKDFVIYPAKDDLYLNILDKSLSYVNDLESNVQASGLKQFEKDFILLWLHNALSSLRNENFDRESVDKEADVYITRYTLSPFISYVNKYIVKEFIEGTKGIGYYLSLGYGAYRENTNTYFKDIANLGLGLEFNYKKIYFDVSINLGGSDLKQNISYPNNTWLKDEYAELFNFGLQTGYYFKSNESILIPFIGIGLTEIMPSNSDIQSSIRYEEFGTGLGQFIAGGISFKYLLAETEYANIIKYRYEKLQWLLNISLEYHQNFYPDERFNGGMVLVKIGLGTFYDGSYRNM